MGTGFLYTKYMAENTNRKKKKQNGTFMKLMFERPELTKRIMQIRAKSSE